VNVFSSLRTCGSLNGNRVLELNRHYRVRSAFKLSHVLHVHRQVKSRVFNSLSVMHTYRTEEGKEEGRNNLGEVVCSVADVNHRFTCTLMHICSEDSQVKSEHAVIYISLV